MAAVPTTQPLPEPRVSIPAQIDLLRLTQMVAQTTQIPLHYNQAILQGQVNLNIRELLGPVELWRLYNQVLLSAGLTSIVSSDAPLVYRIVSLPEAAQVVQLHTGATLAALAFQPGFLARRVDLRHLTADQAVKLLAPSVQGVVGLQLRPTTPGQLILAGSDMRLREVLSILEQLDIAGAGADLRAYQPKRTQPQALQAALTQTWSGMSRVSGQERPVEIQIAPDGRRLLFIASASTAQQLELLAQRIDDAEPTVAQHYQPKWFSLEDVANLIQQTMAVDTPAASADPGAPTPANRVRIVIDRLTGSLIIRATSSEHAFIRELIQRLDSTPEGSRKTARTFLIRHRDVDELATTLGGLIRAGIGAAAPANPNGTQPAAPDVKPISGADAGTAGNGNAKSSLGSDAQRPVAISSRPGTTRQIGDDLTLTTDPHTSRLIAIGDPARIDLVAKLLQDLDVRQPQVDLEIIMVSLSQAQNSELGVELIRRIQSGELEGSVGSLFGLSTAPAGAPLTRALPASPAGFSGIIVKPGDFAGVVRALETVTEGRTLVRARIVVANNSKADLNSVLQQPIASVNAGQTVATTSFAGTSDAGTQVGITPQISAADQVSLSYAITQSAFVGQPVVAGGSVLPPPKRSDNVSSLATVPNGFVVAIGGISAASTSEGESRLPLIGSIPLLGALFKSRTTSESDSRFYVFIKATILRHQTLEDLRFLSQKPASEANVPTGEPAVGPQLIR